MLRGIVARVAVAMAVGGGLILTTASAADPKSPESKPPKVEPGKSSDKGESKPAAKEPAKPKFKSPLTEDQVQVPDGDSAELERAIRKAQEVVAGSGLTDQADQMRLYAYLVIKAADKLLAHKDSTEKQKDDARSAKFGSLNMGNRFDRKTFGPAFQKYADYLVANEPKTQEAQLTTAIRFRDQHLNRGVSKETSAELVKLAKAYPENTYLGQLFAMASSMLEARGQTEEAKNLVQQGVKLVKGKEALAVLELALRRLSILGNAMEIAGPTLTGSNFDVKSLRGKVVLVDFWATWCGPCVAELPNVKKVYEKFHDKGFEVVAISLDNDRTALADFVEKEKLPWVQVFFDTKEQRKPNPLAYKYGIQGIPAMFLLDRDGKAVKANVRGEEALEAAVDELIEKKPAAAPLSN